jgi:anti-sigma B factor antagonist
MAAELTITSADDGARLDLAGELDTHTAPQLVEHLEAVADGADLVVGLAAVSFISSAGLSALLNAQRRLAESGGSLVVDEPSAAVGRLIELSGVADKLGLA